MARPRMGDERRDQILEAFERCVIRKGLAKTTLADVADESGLPRSLVRYFVGNRADMVNLLIERMVERAEDGVARLRPKARAMTAFDLVDCLFENTFANDISNSVVGELWYMAGRDKTIASRLAGMYDRIVEMICAQMKADEIGKAGKEREAAAFTILSLVYGQASLRELGMAGSGTTLPAQQAHALLMSLSKGVGAKQEKTS